jgi:DNA-binding NtrC family response regulator
MSKLPTALVVDDDQDVCEVFVGMLSRLGYDPVKAFDAQSALAVLGSTTIDLVVTDVVMPGKMDGIGLAEIIGESWPATKVICVSGYAPDKARLEAVCKHFLKKPFSYMQLAAAISGMDSPPRHPGAA